MTNIEILAVILQSLSVGINIHFQRTRYCLLEKYRYHPNMSVEEYLKIYRSVQKADVVSVMSYIIAAIYFFFLFLKYTSKL